MKPESHSDRAPSASHSMRAGRSAERSPAQVSPEQKHSAQPEPLHMQKVSVHFGGVLATLKGMVKP